MLIRGIIVLAVIVSCFAVLYPKIIGPLISRILGKSTKSDDSTGNSRQHSPQQGMPQGDFPPNMRHNMRPGPHPGMRAAAEMQQNRQSQGSGRGMMGVVLPMYAVGIVVYLVYTLIKVFNKRNPSQIQRDKYAYQDYEQSDIPEGKFTLDDNFEGDENFEDFLVKKQKQREMEKILTKPDERHISDFEMEQLQRRLAETEEQMAQILEAMQAVQKKVTTTDLDTSVDDSIDVKEEMTDITRDDEKISKKLAQGEPVAKSSDSSPDMNSYDIVGQGSSNSSKTECTGVKDNPHPDIENITPAEVHSNDDNKMNFDQGEEEEEPCIDDKMVTDKVIILDGHEVDNAEVTNLRKRKARTDLSN